MKLSQLAAKPKLIEIKLEDEETITEFGETVEFFTWDRQPLDVFIKLANAGTNTPSEMIDLVRTLILDENGVEIIKDGVMLPSNVLMRAIGKIVETLGK